VGTRFSLQQFTEVFRVRNPDGLPYILIDRQAVNYWAELYLASEPALRRHFPFTSEDIDFRGNRDDVQHIAGQLNQKPVYPHRVRSHFSNSLMTASTPCAWKLGIIAYE
jgi:hypothetical protein